MMPKVNAPIHRYKSGQKKQSHTTKIKKINLGIFFWNFFLGNGACYGNLDQISVLAFNKLFKLFNNLWHNNSRTNSKHSKHSKLKHYYFYYGNKLLNLPMMPNQTKQYIYLCNFEYNLLSRHVEYYDQQVGTRQSILGNKDVKIMKTGHNHV